MERQVVEIIPFKTFKEKIRLVTECLKIGKVICEKSYIWVYKIVMDEE